MPQRSPLTFWLLLAATISVDAVAFAWAEAGPPDNYGFIAFDALVLSQISVVCTWAGLRSEKSMWTRFSPLLAVVLASLVWGMFSERHFIGKVGEGWSLRMGLVLVNQGLHAAILLAMLWLFKRTALWKRRSDWAAEWQFSIADLLVGMTVVAVLGAGMQLTDTFDNLDWADIATYGCPALLAISGVLIWSLWRTHWVLRASGVMGAAIGLVAVVLGAERHLHFATAFPVIMATNYLIQAVVLTVWLAWEPLLPRARSATTEP
jgi:hypothetical protein